MGKDINSEITLTLVSNTRTDRDFLDRLSYGSNDEILSALNSITYSAANTAFPVLKNLTTHYLPTIRAAALRAMRFIDLSLLSDIIRDALMDDDRRVNLAARELFHQNDLAA